MRRLAVLFGSLVGLGALLAVAPAALAGGGCHGGGTPAAVGASIVVKIDGCTFVPTVNRVPVGGEVVFANTSRTPHDVIGAEWAWQSPDLEPGESYSRRFNAVGLYAYSCSLHPGMAGVIEVVADDIALANDTTPIAPAPVGDDVSVDPVAAGGLGLLIGALGGAFVVRRRSYPAA